MTPFAQHSHPEDPYQAAMTERPRVSFGKLRVEVYWAVFVGAQGEKKKKESYDSQNPAHQNLRPGVSMDFVLTPIDATKPIQNLRSCMDWGQDFQEVVRPSLQKVAPQVAAIRGKDPEGKDFQVLREINELFVRIEWRPYKDRRSKETFNSIAVTDVYPDEAQCRDAATKELGVRPEGTLDQEVPFPSDTNDQEAKERDAMVAFLPALWAGCNQDRDRFLAQLANPPYNKWFTAESEEVKKVMVPF